MFFEASLGVDTFTALKPTALDCTAGQRMRLVRRIQVKAVGKHAYKKHKVAELLDLREKLRCLAAAVEGPQLQEPGSSSQDCRGSISSTERAAKRQRTAGGKVTVTLEARAFATRPARGCLQCGYWRHTDSSHLNFM